jgi:cytidine deaminase
MRPANASELDLYAIAQGAAVNAYAPYSKFPVGAALVPEGGIAPILGVNVENASFGVTMCAERSALFAAVAAGHRRFATVAVYADAATCPPCGACRQALAEFAPDITVVFPRRGDVVAAQLPELLPERFEL